MAFKRSPHSNRPDRASPVDGLAALFDRALRRGDATCVIATGEIRDGLASRLRNRGWDIGAMSLYLAMDATDAVSRFMCDGLPDPERLASIARELDQYRMLAGQNARLVLFGNTGTVLDTQGNTPAILTLERLWNSLTGKLPFLTVCGYDASGLHDDRLGMWSSVCGEHAAISHAHGS